MLPLSTRVPLSSLARVPAPLRVTPRVAVAFGSTRTAVLPVPPLTRLSTPAVPAPRV